MGDEADRRWVDDMATAYERWLVPSIFEPCADDLVARVVPLAPTDVLELAAGTGVVTRRLTAALPGTAVTATDLNPAMVAEGSRNAPAATWRQADAMSLPFDDASFDVVVCEFGIMFFPDRPAALAEALRVLRPGGHLVVNSWDTVEANGFAAAFQDSVRALFPDDPPLFLERTPHAYHDLALLESDARAGGFAEARAERCVLEGHAPSARDVAKGFCLGCPVRPELEERGDLATATERIADEMARRLGEGPISGPLAFVVLEATKAA